MLKNISINLTGPICKCEKQHLGWGMYTDGGMRIFCNTCSVEVKIPHMQLLAYFTLDVGYPRGIWQKNEESKINPGISKADKDFLKGLNMKND